MTLLLAATRLICRYVMDSTRLLVTTVSKMGGNVCVLLFIMLLFSMQHGLIVVGVQAKLKAMIADAKAKGETWTRDWDKVPFPLSTGAAAKPARVVTAPVGKGRASRCAFCFTKR